MGHGLCSFSGKGTFCTMKRAGTSERLPAGLPTRILIGLVGNCSAESAGTVMTTVASKTVMLVRCRSTLRTSSERALNLKNDGHG
ncbi:hypothetical protein D9X30_5789 (plasmid) [Cupriavidus sp. U2]|nr:hypothetical protein D9X30_5789 [Cupriavidus sp. U2]